MLPSVEGLAMALIAGLYLQDTLLLLYDNEGVLERRGAGDYRVRFGARSFHLAGRDPCLPNPLTPWRIVLRFAWHVETSSRELAPSADFEPEDVHDALRRMAWGMAPIAAGLFVGLPACLYFSLGWIPFLCLVGFMYAGAAFMLVELWLARHRLALRRAALLGLTFESLVCLPCALNLPRKVSSRLRMREGLLEAARPRVSAAEFRRATAQVVERVDERLAAAETGSPEWNALTRYRAQLAEVVE